MGSSCYSGTGKHGSMRKIFSFKDPGPERSWIGIKAPSLVHEDSLVSMVGGGYSQPSGLFGKCDCFPVNNVASPVVADIALEEVTTQFIYVVTDLWREKRSLHSVYWDRGDRSLD